MGIPWFWGASSKEHRAVPLFIVAFASPQERPPVILHLGLSGDLILLSLGVDSGYAPTLPGPGLLNELAAGPKHKLLGLPQLNVLRAGPPLHIKTLAFFCRVVPAGGITDRRPRHIVGVVVM